MMDTANFAGATNTVLKPDNPHDFHKTQPEPIEALIRHYKHILVGKRFHDGSCGDGSIQRVMHNHGLHCMSTDLIHRGFGLPGVDFLSIDDAQYPLGHFSTIQNPPFSLWVEFVEKCHELKMPFIAIFGKQQVWNTIGRVNLWDKHPPKAIHPLTWRCDFSGKPNPRPIMDCCWSVWGDEVPFSNEPLRRPK